ncbi:MAG: hypothetical protein JXR96_15695 [Deltaproteobacteria bacterium]|nr:hypothetical protein [Deltaproteobacteria bacterium]
MRRLFAAALTLAAACGAEQAREPVCFEDEVGPTCLERIETEADFESISVGAGQVLGTKFMLPLDADDPDLLPIVFQNSQRWQLHIEFLRGAFPERFGDLGAGAYMDLILYRQSRDYYAGGIQRLDDAALGRIYGFFVWTDLADPAELLDRSEIRDIYFRLREVFAPETLAYMPNDPPAVDRARSWIEPDFPIYLGREDVRVEVYTAGEAYGTLRLLPLADFEDALRRGELSWRDIVVIDRVPFDIEAVVAAVVTGGRQWELSHVNVRMARRGTPNLYVRDPLEALAALDGQLVHLRAELGFAGGADRYEIEPASQSEAEAWWSSHRPDAGEMPAIDASERRLQAVCDMDAQAATPLVARYGGKVANLALLYGFLPESYQVEAFGIPFAYFEELLSAERLTVESEEMSLRAYVDRLATDERMSLDAAHRRAVLWDLRNRILAADVDPLLEAQLVDRILTVFGDPLVKVRFRSSSNVEDALEFSGAGLYSSTSVCAADDLDGDRDGPSRCDPTQEEERTVERGLRTVWASLFNDRAWEERDWYQVDQAAASMAILVSRAFQDEIANGVAFTGNPQDAMDDRYLINAQLGDEAVVGNDPAIVPERDMLKMELGQVDRIYRERPSVLAEPGTWVLSDGQLHELGTLLYSIARDFPLDTGGWGRDKVLLDLEFKVDARDGRFRIKQIRPFLDKCRHVRCNQAPEDVCLDGQTLLEYSFYGSCDPLDGQCRYESEQVVCENGCADGACL